MVDESEINDKSPEELLEMGITPDEEVKPYKNMYYTWVQDNDGKRYHFWFTKKKGGMDFINKFYEVFGVKPKFIVNSEDEEDRGDGKKINNNEKDDNNMEEGDEPQIVLMLSDILSTTSGIQPKFIEAIKKRVSADPDFYSRNPMFLMKVLMNAGLSWIKARDIADQLYAMLYKDNEDENPWLGMYPLQNSGYPSSTMMMMPPAQQYRQNEDPDAALEKKMNSMMMKLMTINMIKSLSPPQNVQQLPPQNAIVEYEPVLDKDGNPVTDASGQVVMKQRVIPVTMQRSEDSKITEKLIDRLADGGGKSEREDLAEKLTDRLIEFQEKMNEAIRDMTASQINDLKERLSSVESVNPLTQVREIIDTLKDMGVVSGPREESLDAVKMKLDFDKWKHEQDMELRKWLEDNRMKLEDKKYAREQMKTLAKTTSEAITKVAVPIAQGMGAGYREGLKARAKMPKEESKEEEPQVPKKSIKELTNEELLKIKSEAEMSKAQVEEVQKQVVAEIQRRGI